HRPAAGTGVGAVQTDWHRPEVTGRGRKVGQPFYPDVWARQPGTADLLSGSTISARQVSRQTAANTPHASSAPAAEKARRGGVGSGVASPAGASVSKKPKARGSSAGASSSALYSRWKSTAGHTLPARTTSRPRTTPKTKCGSAWKTFIW